MMANAEAETFLAQPNICVLATIGPDGAPHAMPMWYLYDNGEILFAAGQNSQKVRNVERLGKATVVVDHREPPYYAVMVKGTASIGPALDRERMFALASRYIGEDRAERYLLGYDGSDSVSIRVRPDRFVEFHGRAGRDDDSE